jgi:hypothetical protein
MLLHLILAPHVAGPCLALVPQSGAKEQFYCTVYIQTVKLREHLKI